MLLQHESAASMEQSMPENLSTHVYGGECEMKLPSPPGNRDRDRDLSPKESTHSPETSVSSPTPPTSTSTTKVKLSFSVDRLLGSDPSESLTNSSSSSTRSCCDGSVFSCCIFPHCFSQSQAEAAKLGHVSALQTTQSHHYAYAAGLDKLYPNLYMDYKSVLRPTPIRANEHATSYPTLATNALLRFHQQHHHQQHPQHHQPHHQPHHQSHLHQQKPATNAASTAAALLAPLHSLKSLQLTQQQRFLGKSQQQLLDNIPTSQAAASMQNGSQNGGGNGNGNGNSGSGNSNGKRKRSWSRAVFTNLQRKGLEIQFQQQKYITKPDRRKLAARLNLTDAQVKVWFQNRRMKWRHTRENLKSGQEKQPHAQPSSVAATKATTMPGAGHHTQEQLDYSSDSCSSAELSEQADDDIEIDVVE